MTSDAALCMPAHGMASHTHKAHDMGLRVPRTDITKRTTRVMASHRTMSRHVHRLRGHTMALRYPRAFLRCGASAARKASGTVMVGFASHWCMTFWMLSAILATSMTLMPYCAARYP